MLRVIGEWTGSAPLRADAAAFVGVVDRMRVVCREEEKRHAMPISLDNISERAESFSTTRF